MSFGERLEQALSRAGKSRQDLATHLTVSVQSIGKAINGGTKAMSAEHQAKAARYLRVDLFWLVTGEGAPDIVRNSRPMSPMAFEIVSAFDQLPVALRDAVYAQLMGTIDFAIAVHGGGVLLLAAPTPAPAQK